MYKLTVVSGPNLGATFMLRDGENSVGRQTTNNVVLASSQVSKRHCVLVASNGQILVRDEGSSNGTFVNGVLVKSRKLQAGDRISVGEYVLEVTSPVPSRPKRQELEPIGGYQDNVVPFTGSRKIAAPGFGVPGIEGIGDPLAAISGVGSQAGGLTGAINAAGTGPRMPTDLKGKALWYFDNYVMPIFYGMNLKHEWRLICVIAFAGFLVVNILVSVQPLLSANSRIITKESGRRAKFIAQEMADRNAPALAAGMEGKTEIGTADKAEGVSVALLMDLDQRIIAPAERANQYMVQGDEARIANQAAELFRNGRETGVVSALSDTVVAVEPIKVFNAKLGKNVTVAMAVVAVDISISKLGLGEVGTVYSETLILTGLLGALLLFILYRLTLKPFQILNEDMDKALKGDITQVTHEFKMEEMDALWDLINSALQRIPRGNDRGGSQDGIAGGDLAPPDQFIGPVKMIADAMKIGLVICGQDRKIAFANATFEELSGIRADAAVGQEVSAVARDQSLGVLTQDLFDRSAPGSDGVSEDYDFSGISCSVHASAFGAPGEGAKAYVLVVVRKSE